MHAKHIDGTAGLSGLGSGIPATNTSKKQPTAAAGPGPSTIAAAAAARKHGRKIPATSTMTMPVIELTDSEGDNDDEERNRKRAKNTAMVVSRIPLRPVRATKPTSTSSTSLRRVAATGPKAVHTHVGGSFQGASKDRDKEKAPAAVPLFLDDDGEDDEEQSHPSTGSVVGDVTDKAGDFPLASQPDAPENEEQALAEQDEDVLNDEQADYDLPGVPVPPPPPQEPLQDQHHDLAQDQQQQPIVTGDDELPPYSVEPETGEDMVTKYMAQILEILPDVDPDYLIALLIQLHPQHEAETMNVALTMLFDDPKHPKVDRSGKGKGKRISDSAEDNDRHPAKKVKLDYVDYSRQDREFRGGHHYVDLAVEHLQISFPYIPRTYLRKILTQHNMLYAPTHIYSVQLYKQHQCLPKECPPMNVHFPFLSRKTPYRPLMLKEINDAEFEKEKRWVELYDSVDGDMAMIRVRFIAGDDAGEGGDEEGNEKGKGKGKATDDEDDDEDEDEDCPEGEGIECGCCFTEYSFEKMIQCPEAHLFCRSCMKTYASNLLGSHDIRLKCIHQSGCKLLFPESELRRVLPQKLIDLYDRLKQQKEIEEADLEGLEECPFCDYKCVIEVDKTQEKLFRCGNFDGGCGAISCRECKRLDHLPKSCKEMDKEKVLDGQHAIEEAMSAALMRSCPKCKKPFVKDSGCNKITCYTCSTTSCYVCRKVITGYDHFDQQQQPLPANASTSKTSPKKCPLWEPVETRHTQEVRDAAAKAIADFKADHPDVDHEELKVDVPKAVEAPARPGTQLNPNLLRPPVLPAVPIVHNPVVAAPARGRGRGNGRRRARARARAQPQPQPPPPPPQPPLAQPVQPMDPLLRLRLLAQPVLPPMPAAAVQFHHHHHIPALQPAGMWQQNPPQAAHYPLPGGAFGQVPPLPMAAGAVPQAQVFGFHFPANLNLNPAMQVQQPQQNILPLRQNPPRRGRYMPQPQPLPNINMNVNPNPNPNFIQVQAQNQPAQRRRAAWR